MELGPMGFGKTSSQVLYGSPYEIDFHSKFKVAPMHTPCENNALFPQSFSYLTIVG